jgi:hypothetical protein
VRRIHRYENIIEMVEENPKERGQLIVIDAEVAPGTYGRLYISLALAPIVYGKPCLAEKSLTPTRFCLVT